MTFLTSEALPIIDSQGADDSKLSTLGTPHNNNLAQENYINRRQVSSYGTPAPCQVQEDINTANDNVVAYGIWEDGDLVRMVVTSTEVYTTDDEDAQEGRNRFEVNLVGVEGRNATVKRLFVPQTTAMHGLTWAGQSFDTEDGKPTGEVSEETLDNGVLQIDASSAVLICFK
ncbi:hypothetical protein C365_04860 [Cryptococcus neoformans Bt85]|nr:hypothetical protein C365_04860 [Cryptococcus neoformans var. grubii Bt85]